MLKIVMAAGLAGALLGGSGALARDRDQTTICLRSNGDRAAAVCHHYGGRGENDFCICPDDSREVKVSWCAQGQKPPAENRALNAARKEAARDGTLIGDTFKGRPMCVSAHRRPL